MSELTHFESVLIWIAGGEKEITLLSRYKRYAIIFRYSLHFNSHFTLTDHIRFLIGNFLFVSLMKKCFSSLFIPVQGVQFILPSPTRSALTPTAVYAQKPSRCKSLPIGSTIPQHSKWIMLLLPSLLHLPKTMVASLNISVLTYIALSKWKKKLLIFTWYFQYSAQVLIFSFRERFKKILPPSIQLFSSYTLTNK